MTIPEPNLVISIRFRKTEVSQVADRFRRYHCPVPSERSVGTGEALSSILFHSYDHLYTV